MSTKIFINLSTGEVTDSRSQAAEWQEQGDEISVEREIPKDRQIFYFKIKTIDDIALWLEQWPDFDTTPFGLIREAIENSIKDYARKGKEFRTIFDLKDYITANYI